MKQLASRLICGNFLVVAVVVAGCSRGPAVGTVNGEVNFDGQPVADGHIAFMPVDGNAATGGAPIIDGKFKAEKVPATKMKVQIHGNKKTGRKIKAYETPDSPVSDEIVELLPPKYHFQSELTLDVKPGAQDVKYDLKK
jgi:hypothetical protein